MRNTFLILIAITLIMSCNTNKSKANTTEEKEKTSSETKSTNNSKENNTDSDEAVNTYWINSYQTSCQGEGEKMCMLIQKGGSISPTKWQYFYSEIKGFDYEPGFIYKVKIKEEKLDIANVPADGSSIKYTLIEVLEKNKEENPTSINGLWFLKTIKGIEVSDTKNQKIPQITFDTKEMKYSGNDGCNEVFGKINTYNELELDLGAMAGTKMLCEDMKIPDAMLHTFKTIKSYKLEGKTLSLINKEGKSIMAFTQNK